MDPPSHLSVIVDLSPVHWSLSARDPVPLSLTTFFAHLLAFLNCHAATKPENTLSVFGALPGNSALLYASTDPPARGVRGADPPDPNAYHPFKLLDAAVASSIQRELDASPEEDDEAPVALVGALTKSLCHINRVMNAQSSGGEATVSSEPRILILSVSPDLSSSYIPIMNCIFSAQKLKVTMDICQVYGSPSVFLQQAAHLTGGAYVHLERRDALLQYLMMAFLPTPTVRQTLAVPTQDKVDFRAACFCHKRIIDVGFVCSVCLSIFCQPVPVCSTCRTKFPIKTLQRLKASMPSAASVAAPSPSAPTSNPSTPRPSATNGQRSLASSLR